MPDDTLLYVSSIYIYIYIYYSMLLNWLHVYIHLQLDRNECSRGRVLHLLRTI